MAGCRTLEVDCHLVDRVGPAALRILDRTRAHLEASGGELTLTSCSDAFVRAAQLYGYAGLLRDAAPVGGR